MSLESKLKLLDENRANVVKSSKARERVLKLFDEGTFMELDTFAKAGDIGSGVITGFGYVFGSPAYVFSQDSEVDSGAVGKIHAKKIKKVYDLAIKTGTPVIGIFDSNGAKLSEGNEALAAYGEMLLNANNLSGVVPQISLVLGTCAGSAAMVACSADFVIMSEQAEFFMTAPFVANAKGEGVEGAGTAKNAAKSGAVHIISKDDDGAIEKAKNLISMLPLNNLSSAPFSEYSEDENAAGALTAACENIDLGLNMDLTVAAICDNGSLVEISEDFGASALTALATIAGSTCGIVATRRTEKCSTLDMDACSKIARFVSICDAFAIPVVTLIDTDGFAQSSKDELLGSIRESAKVAHVYAEATSPKVSVILGNAIGSAYIALAGKNSNSDITLAWPSAVISALNPEAAVTVLWNDRGVNPKELIEEYKATLASPFEAAKGGYIDDVIDPANTRAAIISSLEMLAGKRVSKLPKKHSNIPM